MFRFALPLIAAVTAFSTAATAQAASADQEAWTAIGGALKAQAAGVTLPQTVATLSLSKSGEASQGGKGVDNYAQYLSQDGAIQATLYVYMPSLADASLAAYMTDRAIMERFGSKTRRTAYAAVPVAGAARGAIRAVYDDAGDGALTTAAAFIHVGRWIVKLRITGPKERRLDVLAGLDGMVNALDFDQPSQVLNTSPASFADCPEPDGPQAQQSRARVSTTAAAAFPSEASAGLCVRGHVRTEEGAYEVLQQAGVKGGSVIVPMDDSGAVLTFDPAPGGQGYQMSIHSIGQTDIYGVYDRVPNERQIAAMLEGKDPQTASARQTTHYAANGVATVRSGAAAR